MGNRTQTLRNPNHPNTVMHRIGQRAKEDVRRMSNVELDEFLKAHVKPEDIDRVLTYPRHRKIKLVKDGAMLQFINQYKAKVEEEKKAQEVSDEDSIS